MPTENEIPYSNREVREMFDHISETLSRIEAQTTKTNGRVTKLEEDRNKAVGGLKAVVACSSLVVALVCYVFLFRVDSLSADLKDHVNETDLKINK